MRILMRKILHLKVMGPSLVLALSLKLPLTSLYKNDNLNLNLPKMKTKKKTMFSTVKRRTINVGVKSLEDTASENDASESSSSRFSRSSLLDNKNSSSGTDID